MSTTFEAIEGVLLALPAGLPPDTVTACEDSLLLSWLAANKADDPAKISQILGQIGWLVSQSGTSQSKVAVSKVGATIMATAAQGVTDPPDFGTVLNAAAGTPHDLAAGWWAKGSLGHFLATAAGGDQTRIYLTNATVKMPDPWRVLFDPAAEAEVSITQLEVTLNPQVFDGVKADIEAKVAPYRKDILKYTN